MDATPDSLPELIAAVYEAAIEPALWNEAAAMASRCFQAPYVTLGVVDRRGAEVMRASNQGVLDMDLGAYTTPQTNPGIAFSAMTPSATVALRDGLIPDAELERLSFYQELLRPRDLWHVAIMNAHRDNVYLAPVGFLRERRQRPFDMSELGALRAFAPHINRALRVTLRLQELAAREAALDEMGDRAQHAIVQTDAFGRVAEANALARAIFAEADGLFIRDGVLRAFRGDDSARLGRLIVEAAGATDRADFARRSGVVQVVRPSGRRPLALAVSPTRGVVWPFGRSHAVTIAFADPERAPEADTELLARLHGFTAREAAVAALLVKGHSPREAGDELAMSENTVRTHIRHVFDKTGVERLADLVRLLMQGPGVRGR
jgi:DNA-binding CsgD family transcriptional regulator